MPEPNRGITPFKPSIIIGAFFALVAIPPRLRMNFGDTLFYTLVQQLLFYLYRINERICYMQRQRGNSYNREIIIIIVLLFIFFWMLVGICYYPPLKNFDYAVNNHLKSIHSQLLTAFMVFVTDLGAWGVAFAGTVAAVALAMKRKWYLLTVWICAHLGAVALNETIKGLIGRPRPPLPHLVHVTTFSYPSGHALVSVVAYGLMSYYLTIWRCTRAFKSLFIVVWVILFTSIGFSRMYLQVHYFSDVIAGYSIGAAWLIVCIRWAGKAA